MSTSARSQSRSTVATPSGCFRSTPTLRRLRSRLAYAEAGIVPSPLATEVARSRRSTSAPRSPRAIPANCVGPMFGSSMTLIPESGPRPMVVLLVELVGLDRVLAEELGPHVVAEGDVGELGEDAVVGEARGEVPGPHHLVGAAR